jgi:hypothetical protein
VDRPDRGEQEQRPVVGEQEQPAEHAEGDDGAPGRSAPDALEAQGRGQREHHDEQVHARLGGVAHRPRQDGEDDDGGAAQRDAAEAGAEPVGQQQGDRQQGDGQQAYDDRAGAEGGDPGLEQQVVDRRGAVLAQRGIEVRQRQAGDLDAERLVEPQRSAEQPGERACQAAGDGDGDQRQAGGALQQRPRRRRGRPVEDGGQAALSSRSRSRRGRIGASRPVREAPVVEGLPAVG